MVNLYLYDGTFNGMLSAVFDALNDLDMCDIVSGSAEIRENFTVQTITAETDERKAERIMTAAKKIYDDAEFDIYRVFLTSAENKEHIIFDYLKILFKKGRQTNSARFMPEVDAFLSLLHHYSRETQRMYGFVRFSKTENGIYFSKIFTDHSQLEMLSPFFLNRMPGMKWVILDVNRKRASLCNGTAWVIQDDVSEDDITAKYDGSDFERWWKEYAKAIAIKERKNPELQKKLVPLKYRKGMCEFNELNQVN